MDLRYLFLVLAGITGLLFIIRTRGAVLTLVNIGQIIIDFLLVPAAIATVLLFLALIFRVDPLPLIREAAYQLSFQQLVSYDNSIPPRLADNIDVQSITRLDTDGDGFREWVVFYLFELKDGTNPVKGVVYDNDRGDPPVIFPYSLRPPNRDYLSEDGVQVRLEQVTQDTNGPDATDLREIVVDSTNTLNIFRFRENSEQWDFPRDAPPRYEPIGFFRGSGGVSYNATTREVTVLDRDGFERSQLAVRSVYTLNPVTNSFLDSYDPTRLSAPVVSTIDFLGGPPTDILGTAFPEKIVLAFLTSTCGNSDGPALCRSNRAGWQTDQFLAGDALVEAQRNNSAYFGLPGLANVTDISVSLLRYYPQLETDPDLFVTGQGRDVVTGEEPNSGRVDVSFVVNNGPLQSMRFEMGEVNGQWKIIRRLTVEQPILAAPTAVATPAVQ